MLRDDIDDAVDGIRTPQRCAGSTDDLYAFDVLEERVLYVPLDAGVERGIQRAPIHQHQQLVRMPIVEAPDADRPFSRRLSRHQGAWDLPQEIHDGRRMRLPD